MIEVNAAGGGGDPDETELAKRPYAQTWLRHDRADLTNIASRLCRYGRLVNDETWRTPCEPSP